MTEASDEEAPLRPRSGLDEDSRGLSEKLGMGRYAWIHGLLLGVLFGLLAGRFLPMAGGGSAVAPPHLPPAAAAAVVSAGETTCGAVPSPPPPLRRRKLNGKVRNVLVTGGAGFIGSHFALALIDKKGFNVTLVDDLSRGSIETILRLQTLAEEAGQPLSFENLDVNQGYRVEELLRRNSIDMVVHFGANAYVGESMAYPAEYYQNITATTVSLVRAMQRAGVPRLIFSSSCATFGSPATFPITEASPQRPTNPYGQAKLQAEQAIIAFLRAQVRRDHG
jgi:nicotinamidase-related amidase